MKDRIKHLLQKTSRYTKTDMLYFAKGSFWLTSIQLVNTASSFILAIAFANLLPLHVYGTYKYILSVAAILAITTLPGMDIAVTEAVARGHHGVVKAVTKLKLKWGLIGSLLAGGAALYYFLAGNTTLALPFLFIALILPWSEAIQVYRDALFGKRVFDLIAKYQLAHIIGTTVFLLITLLLTKNILILVLVYFLGSALLHTFFSFSANKKILTNEKTDAGSIRFGKHMSATYVLMTIANHLDKVILFQFLGSVEVALYTFALLPVDQLKGFLGHSRLLAISKFVERSDEEIKKTIWHRIGWMTLIILAVIALYILLAPFLFQWFFPQYLAAIPFSQMLAVSLLGVPALIFLSIFEAKKRIKDIYILRVSSALLQIILLVVGVYFFGILGAVVGRTAGRILDTLISGGLYLTSKR